MRIELPREQLSEINSALSDIRNAIPRVQSRVVNRSMTSTVSFGVREVYRHYNLTQTRIRQDFRIFYSSVANPSGKITCKGEPLSLTTFSRTNQVASGVSVQIKRDRPRWIWRHAFIRTVNGARQAFYRVLPDLVARTRDRLYRIWRRSDNYGVLPEVYRYGTLGYILRLTGPRIEDEFGKDRTFNPTLAYGGERMVIETRQQIEYELSRIRR